MTTGFRMMLFVVTAFVACFDIRADVVIGDVVEVAGDVVTIKPLGQQLPGVGDVAQIFGTSPGVPTEVLVGRGKVTELRDGLILAKIDARGTLANGQAARITLSLSPSNPTAPTSPNAPAGFVDLFNGRDLTGWRTPEGSDVAWSGEDGVLRASGVARGWLFTDHEFFDFELQLEYRLGNGANGGLVFRAPNLPASFGPNDPSHRGLEIQLADDAGLPADSPADRRSGALWGIVGPAAATNQMIEQWNSLSVTARGRRVAVVINGTAVLNANLDDYRDKLEQFPGLQRTVGCIGLQAYAGRFEVRNLRIKPLDASVAQVSDPISPPAPATTATPDPPTVSDPPTVRPRVIVDNFPPPRQRPGSVPFTPTRLDWLIVELNAFARLQTLATDRFTLMFTPRPDEDTVVIYVRYLSDADQAGMRSAIQEARNVIGIITRRRGWDGWVRITEDVAAMQQQ